MTLNNLSLGMGAPCMIRKWGKIYPKKNCLILGWFRKNRGNTREWIDTLFLRTILEIRVELDRITRNMREMCFLNRYLSIRSKWKNCLSDLDITIVSIQLTLEKLSMFLWCFDKESDSTEMMQHKKPKLWTSMMKKMPSWRLWIIESIMQGWEHLTSHENSLLIGSIDCDFEYHGIHAYIL